MINRKEEKFQEWLKALEEFKIYSAGMPNGPEGETEEGFVMIKQMGVLLNEYIKERCD